MPTTDSPLAVLERAWEGATNLIRAARLDLADANAERADDDTLRLLAGNIRFAEGRAAGLNMAIQELRAAAREHTLTGKAA